MSERLKLTAPQKRILLAAAEVPDTSRRGYRVTGHQWRPVVKLRALGLIYIDDSNNYFGRDAFYLRPTEKGREVAAALASNRLAEKALFGEGGMGKTLEYREDTVSIEVTFPTPVNLSREHQTRLIELIGDICRDYETRHPDRVMWAAGIGQKMLTNPFMVDDEHPMQFDESVFSIECFDFQPPGQIP